MCLQNLWSRLKTGPVTPVSDEDLCKHSLLCGKWVLVESANFDEFDELLCEHDQLSPADRWTKEDPLTLTIAFVEKSSEWVLTFESRFGVIVNRFVLNEANSNLTPSRHRVISCVNRLVNMHCIASSNLMKDGLKWTALRSVDPEQPNIMKTSLTAGETNATLTYHRVRSI